MLTEDDLRAIVSSIDADAPVLALEVTASTNATALELAEGGAPQWTLVTAAHQTAGRGRHGRGWTDVPGGSLLASVLLRPDLDADRIGLLTLLAGASMAEAAAAASGLDVRCTWPNDLLVDDRKVAGILAESQVSDGAVRAVVLGVGVNLAPPDLDGIAGLGAVDPAALLGAFLRGFHDTYAGPPDALAATIRARWLARTATIGREVRAIGTGGEVVAGIATDVDESGALVIATADGPRTVTSGAVECLR
ncbi:MAG TPA: biotin--[acetyl-CoA-carboxylase] ligase [Actinomycetota bacterium]|nr:biotin--[acetyl-CoA-carboxylase] ligase [Actinomycetota bacterium]